MLKIKIVSWLWEKLAAVQNNLEYRKKIILSFCNYLDKKSTPSNLGRSLQKTSMLPS